MSSGTDLRRLLKLKRLETPGKAYFDAFLDEFHRYQRADLLRQPSLWDRSLDRVHELLLWRARHVVAAGTFAVALLFLASVFVLSGLREGSPAGGMLGKLDISGLPNYVNAAGLYGDPARQQAELKLASLSTSELDISGPKYVTGRAFLAYDNPGNTALDF